MYDIIGDIHGHHDKLKALLIKMGYSKKNGSYSCPERKVLFVGDYIDRGPKIRETLELVRNMVESGNAIALMGNHEYNALCFHFQETTGGHLRKHLIKNVIQHYETLRQFQNRQEEYEDYLEWFKTLPLFFENEQFRAVHACWDATHISFLNRKLVNGCLTDELIRKSVNKGTRFYNAINDTLKGKEMKLPDGKTFEDKDGAIRSEFRIKWWEDPLKTTYTKISILPLDDLPNTVIKSKDLPDTSYYSPREKPVFFGHYWLKGQPSLYRNNVCCLDYSVAKEGKLVAYRFDSESDLGVGKLVWV